MSESLTRLADAVRGNCFAFALRRTARQVSRAYDHALADTPFTIGQFSLATAIALAQPVGLRELTQGLSMERTTLLRNLRPLVEKGLVARRRERRRDLLHLTAEGERAYREAYRAWERTQSSMATALSPLTMADLKEPLKRLEALERVSLGDAR